MEIPNIFRSMIKLWKSRAKEIFMWSWVTAVTCLIVGKGSPPLLPFILAVASIFFITSSVYAYNDVVDNEFDKFNLIKKNRPIPTGHVRIKDAKKIIFIFAFFGLSISLLININSFIFSFIFFLLAFVYSYPKFYFKKVMILKECIVTSGMILTSLVGSYATTNSFSLKAFFASVIFGIFMFTAMPAMQDTIDIDQDKKFGVKTLASIMSWKRKMQMFIIGILIIMTLTPLTYVQLGFNFILPISVVLGGLIFLRYMFPIMNAFEQISFNKTYRIAYTFYLLIQFSYIIGSLNLNFFP